jgi:acetoin utilization protein AcuB
MRLREIMNTAVERSTPEESAESAFERMRRRAIHHLVVVDSGKVVGILSERDLGGRQGVSVRRGRTVGELMTPHVRFADPDTPVRDAANSLRGHAIGCLPVLKGRRLVGIVTTADLLELLGRGAVRPTPAGQRWNITRAAPRWKGIQGRARVAQMAAR